MDNHFLFCFTYSPPLTTHFFCLILVLHHHYDWSIYLLTIFYLSIYKEIKEMTFTIENKLLLLLLFLFVLRYPTTKKPIGEIQIFHVYTHTKTIQLKFGIWHLSFCFFTFHFFFFSRSRIVIVQFLVISGIVKKCIVKIKKRNFLFGIVPFVYYKNTHT